jgi:hypothetical protein
LFGSGKFRLGEQEYQPLKNGRGMIGKNKRDGFLKWKIEK